MKRKPRLIVEPLKRYVAFASESEASPLAEMDNAWPGRYIVVGLICAVNVVAALAERGIKGIGGTGKGFKLGAASEAVRCHARAAFLF
jgi:hypothetical protein